jgi:hypothetical protein
VKTFTLNRWKVTCKLSLCFVPIWAAEDTEKPQLMEKQPFRVPRVASNINIDAHLDEAIWQNALLIEPKFEVRPGENIPAPVKTEVFLAFYETHILIAFKAYDSDPDKIRAHTTDRNDMWSDEWDAIWESKGRITDEGYIVEMVIQIIITETRQWIYGKPAVRYLQNWAMPWYFNGYIV